MPPVIANPSPLLKAYGGLGDARPPHVTAGSAAEALAMFEQFKPDILISDIGMPEEDGYQFMRRVRALEAERGGRIPRPSR